MTLSLGQDQRAETWDWIHKPEKLGEPLPIWTKPTLIAHKLSILQKLSFKSKKKMHKT